MVIQLVFIMEIMSLWNVTPCSLIVSANILGNLLPPSSGIFSTLKMEAAVPPKR